MELTELEAIANQQMRKHGLVGWTFAWARTKRRLGAIPFNRVAK